MFKRFLFFAVCLLMAGSAIADLPDGVLTANGIWRMSLDADGKVTSLTSRPSRIMKVLREKMETAIRGWSFQPGAVNGKPAATDTTLHVAITLWPMADGESYSVKIAGVQTGGDIEAIGRRPSMSRIQADLARKKKVNPLVMLMVTYDASGKPTDIALDDRSPVKEGELVSEAIGAIGTWTFMPEKVAGIGVVARALVPICYAANQIPDCTVPSTEGKTAVESGRSIALESSVQLKSDVIGKTL